MSGFPAPLPERFDAVVVGAGIAGASAAAALAERLPRVLLLEREAQPGYHTTGRSAALLTPFYGNETVRRLNLAGAAFYRAPPAGFADGPVIGPRGALYVAREDQRDLLQAELEAVRPLCAEVRALSGEGARALVPALRAGHVVEAFLDPTAADMDVAAILHAFLRRFKALGGTLRTGGEVLELGRGGEGWLVETRGGGVTAPALVNAAGAWADALAALAGLGPLGIVPKRRTAILVAPPEGQDARGWPAVADVGEAWYVKPDAGKLLCSPADETPTDPCDAQPDEYDVAVCVDRVERALDLRVRRVEHKWAGLRCFAPDKTPVAGEDPRAPGFHWLAGQGGYGIMTAPVLAAVTARNVAGGPLPGWLERAGIDAAALGPGRLLRPR
jgi:D-arginine dehydrogenase